MQETIIGWADNLATGAVTGFLAWFFTRKKNKAETKVVEGDAIKAMQDAYSTFVDDYNNKFEKMQKEVSSLRKALDDCINGN